MHRVVTLAVQVAAADVPVLITGPNGVGKEKLAEIVQANSRRKDKAVRAGSTRGRSPTSCWRASCSGRRPAPTRGPSSGAVGRFEAADGGTLFLDEIGNLSPAGQAKLLRVLQSGEFERLGSSETRQVDVRVLAATNADLRERPAGGHVPPGPLLPPERDRAGGAAAPGPSGGHAAPGPAVPAGSSRRRASLPAGSPRRRGRPCGRHDWPGNVRELMNRIQRAALVAAGAGAHGGGPRARGRRARRRGGRLRRGTPRGVRRAPPASSSC